MSTIKIKNPLNNSWIVLPGIPGKSAYKIATENGYIGTETEFGKSLNLLANSDLPGTINKINEQFISITNELGFLNCTWEIGSLDLDGNEVVNLARLRTGFVDNMSGKTLKINLQSGYKFRLYQYDYLNVLVSYSDSWITTSKEIVVNSEKIRIIFSRTDDVNISLDENINMKLIIKKEDNYNNVLISKKILAIGDSFVSGHTLSDSQTWLYKLANRNNMTKYNYGLNGSSLAKASGQSTQCVMDRLNSILSSVPSADYILVLAGHNDSNASLNGGQAIPIGENSDTLNTTFKGAMNNLIKALIDKYPTGKLLFLTPFNRRTTEEPYVNAMKEICAKYSIPCFDNYHGSGICFQNSTHLANYDLSSSLHLNEKGQERISYVYESILKNELVLNSSLGTGIDTSNIVNKTDIPFKIVQITKTDYDTLATKNINTIYLVEGYGVYIGTTCIISTDNQPGSGEVSGGTTLNKFNTFKVGTLDGDTIQSSVLNRVTTLSNQLEIGSIVRFIENSYYSTYKFAVDKAGDGVTNWIGGGYNSKDYTITETSSYNIMIARVDNADFGTDEITNINNIFGFTTS